MVKGGVFISLSESQIKQICSIVSTSDIKSFIDETKPTLSQGNDSRTKNDLYSDSEDKKLLECDR